MQPTLELIAELDREDIEQARRMTPSQKLRAGDAADARKILLLRSAELDLPYIRQWTDQHGTRDLFERLLTAVQGIL